MSEFKKPEPLKISCTAVDCDNDLHCFKQLKKMSDEQRGKCRACEADLVDWSRLKRRDLGDAAHTFEALQHELIRHHFFHKEIDEGADRHARRKGRLALFEAVRARLEKYLAPAEPARDGRQTPMSGNAIFYAQHATATCCRTCLEYWHAIPKGRQLTEEELIYCQALIEMFLNKRLPGLSASPTKVPPRSRATAEAAALL
ncbi:DUF4186 family protein [Rhizobium sp. WYJ-E13]|uniref:DUF4186 family protein n=1 Tax=Rhizobium sp. WYJ-E13 TaxID=2849093 RepID=UPI001C1EFE1E|nr:DUF4186 family protein [Rhizobium sp. WYJ-E13]QWW72331.1 DUF4186 domain-containing protein [Rhizobium sp. WYJ-E13]